MSAPSLSAAERYLESLINLERRVDWPYRRLGLEPIRALLARIGHPECGLSVVHIAGSKGKGSTALLVEHLLTALGEQVGTFTSPHLERWSERFRVGGREIDAGRLARQVDRVRPSIEALRQEQPDNAPSFFDASTAVALALFAEAGVNRAILEVGLGGRLDSTNAVAPAVTCITSIELEHTDKLGTTLGAIAGEKAGILKPGVPLILGNVAPEAESVIRARAAAVGAPVEALGRDFGVEIVREGLDGLELRWTRGGSSFEVELPLLGRHQAANAALAIAVARQLHPELTPERLAVAAREAFATARLPGRVELFSRAPWILVDSAHTAASAHELAHVLAALPCRALHLVISISAGKDLAAMVGALAPHASRITATRAQASRSLEPDTIAHAIRSAEGAGGRAPVQVVPNPHLAIRAAREALAPDAALCVTGSVYLAGIARGILAPSTRETPAGAAPSNVRPPD